MILIGIAGKKGSGKSTLEKFLRKHVDEKYDVVSYMFAEPLKKAVCEIFGWKLSDLENEEFKASVDPFWGLTPRFALQTLGTEWGRMTIRDDIWLKTLDKRIGDDNPDIAIISDVRFDNEAEYVKSKGGYLIQLYNNDSSASNDSHVSETPISTKCDYYFTNDKKSGFNEIEAFSKQVLSDILCNEDVSPKYEEKGKWNERILHVRT